VAQVAEVEVSGGGEIRVRRVVCAVDCGTIVNPDIVTAQIESGVIYGISGALWGEITLKNGRVEQSNFSDDRVLRMNEAVWTRCCCVHWSPRCQLGERRPGEETPHREGFEHSAIAGSQLHHIVAALVRHPDVRSIKCYATWGLPYVEIS